MTECLNYGLIVSLAGFCCWHHIGPVKVNYWNMFICCQPLQQAVTCMETQTNTHGPCSLKQFTGHLLSHKPLPLSSEIFFLTRHTLYSAQSAPGKEEICIFKNEMKAASFLNTWVCVQSACFQCRVAPSSTYFCR